jgi:hypothetical protein
MKHDHLSNSVNSQSTSQGDDEAENNNLDETGWHAAGASAEHYERCRKSRIRMRQGDWWIAIGLYLVLVSVAFVVL